MTILVIYLFNRGGRLGLGTARLIALIQQSFLAEKSKGNSMSVLSKCCSRRWLGWKTQRIYSLRATALKHSPVHGLQSGEAQHHSSVRTPDPSYIVFIYRRNLQRTQLLQLPNHPIHILNLNAALPRRRLHNLDRLQPELRIQSIIPQTLLIQLLLLRLHDVG
jgi:hypothetical protein